MEGNLFAKPKTFHIQCALLLLEHERIPALEKRTLESPMYPYLLNVQLFFLRSRIRVQTNIQKLFITVLLRNKALESEGKHKETNALKKHRKSQKNYIIFQVLRAPN